MPGIIHHFSSEPKFDGEPLEVVALISREDSMKWGCSEFLIEVEIDGTKRAYEIRYRAECGGFKQALRIGHLIAVGHQEHFYLFDLAAGKNLIAIELDGYFEQFYLDQSLLYVAGASYLHCLDLNGKVIWKSPALGIDGVIVESFDDEQIKGAGEWDPPGGWIPFVLDRATGRQLG